MHVGVPPKPLLANVDLELGAGECVALLGPSGAGKTSLLRILCGLDDLCAGALTLDERTPATLGWPLFRRRVAMLAQRPLLLSGTVAHNLALAFTLASAASDPAVAFDAERADFTLAQLGLGGRLDRDAHSLSVGEQQRVSLVRSLLLRPTVLLADEPTSALDAGATEQVEALLRSQLDEGLAILLVSHDGAHVQRLATRTVDIEPWLASPTAGAAHA